jgi:hypothetical protein
MIRLLLLLSLTYTSSSLAADPIKEIFYDHFYNTYVQAECGNNARRLAQAIASHDNLADYFVVELTNEGGSVFGMVNAESARGQRFQRPEAIEANWYFHVFLVHKNGIVYDFDFGIMPRTPHFTEYIREMFLDEPECRNPNMGDFCVGEERKLKEYQLKWFRADRFLANGENESFIEDNLAESYLNWEEWQRKILQSSRLP